MFPRGGDAGADRLGRPSDPIICGRVTEDAAHVFFRDAVIDGSGGLETLGRFELEMPMLEISARVTIPAISGRGVLQVMVILTRSST